MSEQERLYINDKLIELATESSQFARTLQVNDLVSLDNRQTNFTKNIKIPKTPKNVLALDYLGVIGNNSNLPYQKNTIKYFIGNEAIIYNGWGVISETNAFYNLTVYDGNLDLYKSIENKTLADLSLTAITHTKTLATVVNSFTANLPYKYIVADYNGKAVYNTVSGSTTASTINIDYLVPSVKVSYLWNNIFTQYGYTYEGSIFSTTDFTNLYLTYPKSIPADNGKSLIYNYSTSGLTANVGLTVTAGTFTATEQITIDFSMYDSLTYVVEQPNFYYVIVPTKNGVAINSGINILNAGDVLAVTVLTFGEGYISGGDCGIDKIYKYNSANIEFGENLSGFSIKDFINEILQRFGLSIFKDKYTNNYKFKTLAEITSISSPIDWSNKFQSVDSEKYIYGYYAQKNILKYKYNDENANYNDGAILVNNKNIDDNKTIIQSKIYSPEANTSNVFGFNTNVYKLWNKEVKDTGVISYKDLENRYHFVRSFDKTLSAGSMIGSEILLTKQNISIVPVETFSRLSFTEIVTNYYPTISKILNQSKIVIANINLRYTDITDFDFTKLYYIKQLGGYYLVNKIVNFQIGRQTKVELIKVNYTTVATGTTVVIPTTALAEPTNLTKSNLTTSGATLNWSASASANVVGYNVYKNGTLNNNLGNVLTYNATGLTANTSYTFSVKARDSQGNVSSDSNIISFTTLVASGDVTPPTVPILSRTISQVNEVIHLSWSVSTDNVGVTFYDVYTSLDNVYFESLVARTTSNTYDDYPAFETTTYYRVMALDAAGNYSSPSNTVSGTITPVVCFVEGTLITLSDGTQLPIEVLEVNQLLLSTEIETLTDTNNVDELYSWSNTELIENRTTAPITKIEKLTANKTIVINNGLLEATPEHSQLIKRNGVWKFIQIGMVELGDYLYTINSEQIEVTSVEISTEVKNIYPMSLAPTHTYFANGILTHNIKQQ